ncbi:Putative teichuronic acid biosynthesis glycosyltransferase tuaH [Fibrisoma limi BUZ 3]|uniref:Putative teichuronic acid biosynthesis glycosyltransferase tuaH n=1 Tax=Fibrisoma limi BUZ 3 TaxID=1185876 RepID=I2GPZ6_9BACT|nr:glycosyltransferase [Fibrisoma limi]CCH55974.1 Putative teichuronic acid biosynthesis glycosyltransferase tuaH [Fibrisoma limi BUZ 3]
MENLVSDAIPAGLAGYDVVVVGLQPFDSVIGSNCRDIAMELAKQCRVLYVNPPLDRITAFRRGGINALFGGGKTSSQPALQQVSERLWAFYPTVTLESINRLPDGRLFDSLNRRNNERLARSIQQAIQELGFERIVLFNDSDMLRSYYLDEWLQPELMIYYSRDNLLAVEYWQLHGARLEPALMKKADLVAANSAYLARLAAEHNPCSVDIGQGCDLSRFDPAQSYAVPVDLAGIQGPRIGYVGALSALRLDLNLLEFVALERPDWQLVLVGPEDEAFRNSRLHTLRNVHFLGPKPGDELPAYLYHMAVLMNPQQLNPVTVGNYPRKIDEYLAMGKPVVAVQTEAMAMFSRHVYLADNPDSFITLTDKALRDGGPASPNECIQFARSHTWAASVAALDRAVQEVIQQKPVTV